MKYRDDMTGEELRQFLAEIDALNAAYASAYAEHPAPAPDEWEDETEILHRAALDSRGRP